MHNSTSRSADMIVSIALSLALSSMCLCNFLFLWHYIKTYYFFPVPKEPIFVRLILKKMSTCILSFGALVWLCSR